MEATTSREDVAEASVGVSVGRSASTHGARGREATTPSRSVTVDDDDDEGGSRAGNKKEKKKKSKKEKKEKKIKKEKKSKGEKKRVFVKGLKQPGGAVEEGDGSPARGAPQKDSVEHWNEIRSKLGMKPLHENP